MANLFQRKQFLPEYLERNQLWIDLLNAMDTVFGSSTVGIDQGILDLDMLRKPIDTADNLFEVNSADGKLTNIGQVRTLERALTVQLANYLGFAFKTSNVLLAEDYTRIASNLGQYYATTKGTPGWQNFFAFCLNAIFEVKALWTQDYVTFVEELDAGTPVWEDGGTWYPTTHVRLRYESTLTSFLTEDTIRAFFFYFANINLILESIDITFNFEIKTVLKADGYVHIRI